MKTSFTFLWTLFFISIINTAFAQCDFPEGDFEVWEDVTSTFSDELPAGTIIFPENANPLIRLFLYIIDESFLEGIFMMVSDPTLLNRAILGVERVEDASHGQYALKMGGDSIASTSDLIIVAACGESPDSIFFDAKHFGNTTDSISLFCFVGNFSDLPINEDGSLAEANVNKFMAVNFTASGNSNTFQTLAIDFSEVNSNVSPDTIIFWLILDNQKPEDGNEYGCIVVDNFRFMRQRNTTPTREIVFIDGTKIYPSLARDVITVESDNNQIKGIQIFDLSGKMIHSEYSINAETHQMNVSEFPNGQYIIRIGTSLGYSTEKFFKAN